MTNESNRQDRYLVVGAGFSGLGIAKALAEAGIAYDQIEANDDVGGNWYAGVYNHVHIVSSKRTTEFTDFPMPADYPDFPSAGQMFAYLRRYAEHFGLLPRIELQRVLQRAEPREGGGWRVVLDDGSVRHYRGVIVCNGHHWNPRHPSYPGTFGGEYMHSKQYKTSDVLRGKKVLVIGGGNSACDIAVDAAREGRESHLSIREGTWILPKTVMGRPLTDFLNAWMPQSVQKLAVRAFIQATIGDYADYGLPKPSHDIYAQHPTINSLVPYYVRHGRIKVHPGIQRWDGRTVTFVDGSTEEFDVVVAATGFHVSFPFLTSDIVDVKGAVPQLPFGTFHDRYQGLYIVGWQQPRLGVGPLISAGGPLIAAMIRAEEAINRPIGSVLRKLGIGIPDTHVADGHRLITMAKLGAQLAPLLPRLAKHMFETDARARGASVANGSSATASERSYACAS